MSQRIQARLEALRTISAFALLTLDGWQWLLPQTEVQTLEALLDIDPEVRMPQSIGAIAFTDQWWPVYSLSGELRLLSHISPGRRICALLDNGADQLGLVCDQIKTLAEPIQLHPLPVCMISPDSPIEALALLSDGLASVTTTEHIARMIAMAGEPADG